MGPKRVRVDNMWDAVLLTIMIACSARLNHYSQDYLIMTRRDQFIAIDLYEEISRLMKPVEERRFSAVT